MERLEGFAEGPGPFTPFGKIPRLNRDIVITEKLDGTNGLVYVRDDGVVFAGSRNRWLLPGKSTDNFGFAGWVAAHHNELRDTLGPGRHYGEWYGAKIGRGYGLSERKFALFNTERWRDLNETEWGLTRVPILYEGVFSQRAIDLALLELEGQGSVQEDFDRPEGIIIYHTAAGQYFKVLLEHDELPKGKVTRQEQEIATQRLVS